MVLTYLSPYFLKIIHIYIYMTFYVRKPSTRGKKNLTLVDGFKQLLDIKRWERKSDSYGGLFSIYMILFTSQYSDR